MAANRLAVTIPDVDFNNELTGLKYNGTDLLANRRPVYFSNMKNLIFHITNIILQNTAQQQFDDLIIDKRKKGQHLLEFISYTNKLNSIRINGTWLTLAPDA